MPTKSITRAELYELVWRALMTEAAKKFGISYVGLRKICVRREIPLPKQGHWQPLAAGRASDPPPSGRACSTLQPSSPVLTIPDSLKARCERPQAAFATVGDLGAYAVRMKGAADCGEARSDSIAALADRINAIVHPPKRKWRRFGKPDHG